MNSRDVPPGTGGHELVGAVTGDDVAVEEQTLVCAKCGGPGDGWKCAICGSVARDHDTGHLHGGSDRYCTIRCARCGRADVLCTCV